MQYFQTDGGDDDKDNGGEKSDPVVDPNNLGEEGVRIGEGHDPVEDEVL